MLFKLSIKNMKKSMKDYIIYFLTLILGIAIFYIFNSMDSQQAMMNFSASQKQIIQLMLTLLSGVSIFISIVLAFLIIYANNFLVKRRKKEFGIYMTLGMGKGKISKILLVETFLIGLISLAVGLGVGIFGSQLMSVVVAKMFEADMSSYQFVFSSAAMLKTVLYFGVMYLCVMIFNTISISKYKLIDLLTASRKSEKVKVKNPMICIIVFLISIAILAYAYIHVQSSEAWNSLNYMLCLIGLGILGTFLFFWSLSGFMLKLVQSRKKLYLSNLNMFTTRQISSKINTTVMSMSIISILLFLTTCILSSAISLNSSMKSQLKENTPVDISVSKNMNSSSEAKEDSSIQEVFSSLGFNCEEKFKDIVELPVYNTSEVTWRTTLGETIEKVKGELPYGRFDMVENMVKISDYNKIAKLYGKEQYTLESGKYMIICDYEAIKNVRNIALEIKTPIQIKGKAYLPQYSKCINGFILLSGNPSNSGIVIVPDDIQFTKEEHHFNYLVANYRADTEEGKKQIEDDVLSIKFDSSEIIGLNAISKIAVYDSSKGLGAMATFIGMYLGIIFLISGAAILALKELSESSDNKERYDILRKIGANEKMIQKSLFRQIGVFFLLPLGLSIIHSVFGLMFAYKILETFGKQDMISSIIATAIMIIGIYGGYFIATYIGSKSIIKEK